MDDQEFCWPGESEDVPPESRHPRGRDGVPEPSAGVTSYPPGGLDEDDHIDGDDHIGGDDHADEDGQNNELPLL